uniref:GDT1 family protein n=1 Tax=Desulfobacca acetoxidans TaxID=60893 RepID=A0A7V4G9N5_9BACT
MDWQTFWVTFITVFLAEMGDKTQHAALSLTADKKAPLSVLTGACSALFLATLLGVLVGGVLTYYVPEPFIKKGAGILFLIIGILILLGKW